MYEVVISIPMKIKMEGEFNEVVKNAMEIGISAQEALAKSVQDTGYIDVLDPKIISAVDPYLNGRFKTVQK